jgi:hypothetical protein
MEHCLAINIDDLSVQQTVMKSSSPVRCGFEILNWSPGEARDQRGPGCFSFSMAHGATPMLAPGWFHGKSPQSIDDKKGYPRDLGTQISERLIWMK